MHKPKGPMPEQLDPLPVPVARPITDAGMLSAEDRRKARDVAKMLLDEADSAARALAKANDANDCMRLTGMIRDLAAAVRDLDAVARGPIS